jgi:hypothetical protein
LAQAGGRGVCTVILPITNGVSQQSAAAAVASARTNGRVREILIIDIGSATFPNDRLASDVRTDPRIAIIRRPRCSLAVALNVGLSASHGEFVAFLDPARIWTSDHVDIHLDRLAHDPRLGVTYGAIDADTPVTDRAHKAPASAKRLAPLDFLIRDCAAPFSHLVIRRAVFDDIGLFNIALSQFVEREWLLRASLRGWGIEGYGTGCISASSSSPPSRDFVVAFETLLREAKHLAPSLIGEHEARARSALHRDLAKRALTVGRPLTEAIDHLSQALSMWPFLIAAEPAKTLGVLSELALAALSQRASYVSRRSFP